MWWYVLLLVCVRRVRVLLFRVDLFCVSVSIDVWHPPPSTPRHCQSRPNRLIGCWSSLGVGSIASVRCLARRRGVGAFINVIWFFAFTNSFFFWLSFFGERRYPRGGEGIWEGLAARLFREMPSHSGRQWAFSGGSRNNDTEEICEVNAAPSAPFYFTQGGFP